MTASQPKTASPANGQKIRLVLASNSPRRRDLLAKLGLNFEVVPSHMDETFDPNLSPEQVVVMLAEAKAKHSAEKLPSATSNKSTIILGGDTIVVLDKKIFGQPASVDEACQMLSKLSGVWHTVYTGVALLKLPEQEIIAGYEASQVYIRKLSEHEIKSYVQTGEPMDKAGAYALQGIGAALVERVDGCVTNVIGLPIPLVVDMLRKCGVTILGCP